MAKKFRENVEIISSANGQSGLRLTNLPSGTAQTVFNGILWLDSNGDVIKIDATKIATVTVGPVAPSSPVTGQQWLNTSVSPSELMVYNGTSWEVSNDEVQHYANFAAFPATGDEDVVYIDDATDTAYLWDSTTSAYVSAVGGASGLFSISDGANTQAIGVGNTINFATWALLKSVVSATDTVTTSFDTTGATAGQVPKFNGTTMTRWNADNIYTANGTLLANRVVDLDWKTLDFQDTQGWVMIDTAFSGNWPILKIYETISNTNLTIFADWGNGELRITWNASTYIDAVWNLWLNADTIWLHATNQEYYIWAAATWVPTNATTQTKTLVRDDADGRLYLKDLTTLSSARYANTWTPVANVETVHTHALAAGEDIQIQVRDSATKEIVSVEIRIISATTFWVTSTTTDPLRVIAL